ncbi:MAG TPA: hypothetical protein VMT00_05150 [Thermoanaerobaculia bacterium]|nr:hypothetical protein [Thermoanaerobaculia bacterium]
MRVPCAIFTGALWHRQGERAPRARPGSWPKIPIFGPVTGDGVSDGHDHRQRHGLDIGMSSHIEWPKIPIFGLVTGEDARPPTGQLC